MTGQLKDAIHADPFTPKNKHNASRQQEQIEYPIDGERIYVYYGETAIGYAQRTVGTDKRNPLYWCGYVFVSNQWANYWLNESYSGSSYQSIANPSESISNTTKDSVDFDFDLDHASLPEITSVFMQNLGDQYYTIGWDHDHVWDKDHNNYTNLETVETEIWRMWEMTQTVVPN